MLGDIGSRRELREAMAEVEMRTWYAEKRLAESADSIFSLDNLVSLIMPSGGVVDRLAGGAMNGIATVKGVMCALRKMRRQ